MGLWIGFVWEVCVWILPCDTFLVHHEGTAIHVAVAKICDRTVPLGRVLPLPPVGGQPSLALLFVFKAWVAFDAIERGAFLGRILLG